MAVPGEWFRRSHPHLDELEAVSTPQPVNTQVTVNNPVLGHHPDGSNYTRVDDIENTTEQNALGVTNNQNNISALLTSTIDQAERVAALEASAENLTPTAGSEIDTGATYEGRDLFRAFLTQQSTGISIPSGEPNGVTIFSGVYELRWWSCAMHILGNGANFWVVNQYVDDNNDYVGVWLDGAAGTIQFGDFSVLYNVQNWRLTVEYTKR